MDYPIGGYTAPGFERLQEVFARNFSHDVEVGASVCVTRGDEVLVDLWGGFADAAETRPWSPDTLVNVYSTTKGIAALAFATLVDDGLIGYDDPVSDYWPELGAARGGLTVAELLSHQGGLCGVSETLCVEDLYDWDRMRDLLERQAPLWAPGTAAGYHAITWGYLPGELCRRVAGETLGQRLARRIAQPLQADFHLGLPAEDAARVAPMIGPNRARIAPKAADFASVVMPPLYPIALQNPVVRPFQDASSTRWQRAEIAAANGQANARAIARIYGAVAARMPGLVTEGTLAALTAERVGLETDLVLGRPIRRGAGVILNTDRMFGPEPGAFGHSGAGGSTGFADPARGIGFGYAMNQMQFNLNDDTRGGRLIAALYECLGAAEEGA